MRTIDLTQVELEVAGLCADANFFLGDDVIVKIKDAIKQEGVSLASDILEQILDNARISSEEEMPLCQDTGFAIIFCEIGQEVNFVNGSLSEAINRGVKKGYTERFLRKSMVADPIDRTNTNDNTPAIIHYDVVPGNQLKITVAPKGGGSENMSALKMLKPAEGLEGVKAFVLDTVIKAGPNPCPPIVVGVGIGGTMEKSAILSKQALTRELGQENQYPRIADLEKELLNLINATGIGPQGFGGKTTALAVHIETFPTHIACLPVAVNIGCHSYRHKTVTI